MLCPVIITTNQPVEWHWIFKCLQPGQWLWFKYLNTTSQGTKSEWYMPQASTESESAQEELDITIGMSWFSYIQILHKSSKLESKLLIAAFSSSALDTKRQYKHDKTSHYLIWIYIAILGPRSLGRNFIKTN